MFPPNNAASTPVGAPAADPTADPSAQQAGDGLHHYQADQDESGGWNTVHTGPDGTQTPGGPFNSVDEVSADMQQCCGDGGQMEDGAQPEESNAPDFPESDSDDTDIAGSYAKAAKKSK